MTQETSQIAIIRRENIQTILSVAPQSYQDNRLSREKCIEAGQAILDAIMQGGMTDSLDQQAAAFIEKARKTVKKMNERRSPVTQLFDTIRKEFTTLENAIDPTKADTVPFRLQQLRNQFAAKKRAEEEQRRRKEMERLQAQQARDNLRQDIEVDFTRQFGSLLYQAANQLTAIDNAVTLDNYDASFKQISDYPTDLPADFLSDLITSLPLPVGVSVNEFHKIQLDTKQRLSGQFAEHYRCEMVDIKQHILDRLPSKKANLLRIAQADADEAARIKTEMEARQRMEAEEKEAQLRRKEAEERQKAEMARQQSQMESLFNTQAAMQHDMPKVKVTKKIELLNPEGIMPVLTMWWSKEGCRLSVDELSKMFRKQITFCERLANTQQIFIEDESVCYIDDVKAK